MRWVIVITLACAVYSLLPGRGWPLRAKFDPTVQAALEARCGDVESVGRQDCEVDLLDDFAGGSSEPDSILRLHCTRWMGTWSIVEEEPLPICARRYGGWITG